MRSVLNSTTDLSTSSTSLVRWANLMARAELDARHRIEQTHQPCSPESWAVAVGKLEVAISMGRLRGRRSQWVNDQHELGVALASAPGDPLTKKHGTVASGSDGVGRDARETHVRRHGGHVESTAGEIEPCLGKRVREVSAVALASSTTAL
jgi:hypothetical protein